MTRKKSPNRTRHAPKPPRPRRPRTAWDRMMTGEIAPMNFEGRVITPEVIAEMRSLDPEHAHELDAEWEQEVLDNNRPWIEDPAFRQATEELWAQARHDNPEAFQDCGCADH